LLATEEDLKVFTSFIAEPFIVFFTAERIFF